MEDFLEIEVTVLRLTPKAFLVKTADSEGEPLKFWVPRSQVIETDCLAEGDKGTMRLTEWIAKEKGLIEN